jgi:hypothetical protein
MITTMMKSPVEADRGEQNTAAEQLKKIEQKIEANIRFYSALPKIAISKRISELEREWSIERWLETNASGLAFIGHNYGIDGEPEVVCPAVPDDGIPVFTRNPRLVSTGNDTPENGGSHARGN